MSHLPECLNIQITAIRLSDLFFNHEHPERDKLYEGRDGCDVDREQERIALQADADEFLCTLMGHETDPHWVRERGRIALALADDLLARQ